MGSRCYGFILLTVISLAGLQAELPTESRSDLLRILSDFSGRSVKLEDFKLDNLTGGMSGASLFRFTWKGDDYVIRSLSEKVTALERVSQCWVAAKAGELQIGPRVHFIDSKLEGMVIDFVTGHTLTRGDLQRCEALGDLAQVLRRFHQVRTGIPRARTLFQRFSYLVREGLEKGVVYPSRFKQAVSAMEGIEDLLNLNPEPLALTHHDLNSLNIIYNGERFFVIDWDEGGLGDPYLDLAMFPIFQCFNEEQTAEFLCCYFGRQPSQYELDRFMVATPVALLWRAATFLNLAEVKDWSGLNLESNQAPDFCQLATEHATKSLERPNWQIGLSLLREGLRIVNSDGYQQAFSRLQTRALRGMQVGVQ